MAKEQKSNNLINGADGFPIAGIGASAGGLDAFKKMIRAIPQNSGIAYILMQHLDPSYDTALADILRKETKLPVLDMAEDVELSPDHIYIMPSNKLLVSKNGELTLESRPIQGHPLYSIDIFFTALAEKFQSHFIGILLSGMGTDGTLGFKKIKDYGGFTFVQSPQTAKYPDMPQHAVFAEVADFILPAEEIPKQLLRIKDTLKIIPTNEEYSAGQATEENHFNGILSLLHTRTDVDFTYYKQTTIRRRILRRMVVNKIDTVEGYHKYLEKNTQEQDILYQDLLIPVTSFFRDAAVFEKLRTKVFPEIFENRNPSLPVRIWIAGCSTGEEAYSMAICLHEYLGDKIVDLKVQLFATDLSEKAIQKARSGLYNKKETEGISEERLQKYFTKTDGDYMVKKSIRDLCVFAVHNFLKDPPFAKMDLISCRNVLIYMESYLQKKALATFHYALNEKGMLLLGKSETAGNASELFKTIGKQEKLYERKTPAGRTIRLLPERSGKTIRRAGSLKELQLTRKEDFHKNADDILLAKYTPPAVVVNEQQEIVQFHGTTSTFLEAPPGKASLNILKMAKEGLSFEIRNALHKAKESKETVIKEGIPIQQGAILVAIEVVPLLQTIEPYYLVLFSEKPAIVAKHADIKTGANIQTDTPEYKRIQQLEKDLSQLREDIRTITEDQEAANEELQSANEELLSGSEELQSLNEELETSKEELQSTNEELMTVNQELYDRNEQYNQARLYAEAIVATIREPLLVLNRDLRVKSANQSFYQAFKLTEDAIANRILFELQESKWDIPELHTQLLKIQTGQLQQMEWEVNFNFPGTENRVFFLNARPVTPENGEQLILLAFEDITLRKKEAARIVASAEALKEDLRLMENFFMQAPALFCILKGAEHIFEFANPRYLQVSGARDLKGKTFSETFPELGNEGYKDILDKVYKTGDSFSGKEMKATNYPGSTANTEVYIDLSCQAYRNAKNEIEGVLFFSYEVTAQVLARKQIEENAKNLENIVQERTALLQKANKALEISNKSLQEFAGIASHDLQEPLRKIRTFTGMIKDKYAALLPEDGTVLLSKTADAANRMSTLIHDVLNYSRVIQLEKSFIPTDLNVIIKNITEDFDLFIEEKKAVVHLNGTFPIIEAVPTQMNQLFYNLFSNALKFSSAERLPVIDITGSMLSKEEIKALPALQEGGNYCQIVFSDNGIGFEQQFSEQIFTAFERLNSATEYEGTGIGLALCRKIIISHHGLIWAKGKENKGTSIFIILPIQQTGTNVVTS